MRVAPNHGQPGVILLAAHNPEREVMLRQYLTSAAAELNSTLIEMVETALARFGGLDLAKLSFIGEWSSFVQFITHTYRIVGAEQFSIRVEQILRGTLGFRKLRASNPVLADTLVRSVQAYTAQLSGKPISLVDSTGFSWESVNATLARMSAHDLRDRILSDELLTENSTALSDAIGVLLQVPELREHLVERLDSAESQGDFLSRVVKDWVTGMPLRDLADNYFTTQPNGRQNDSVQALTRCCQRLFGSILPTVSWGLSALQALAIAGKNTDIPSIIAQDTVSTSAQDIASTSTQATVSTSAQDIPSYVYYGVHTRQAVALRLFGVPRTAALALARTLGKNRNTEEIRRTLADSSPNDWTEALGHIGHSYYNTWRLIEPVT